MVEVLVTAQKMKVSIKDFFSKCDQIRRKSYNKRHLRTLDLSSKFEFIFICSICGGGMIVPATRLVASMTGKLWYMDYL